MENDESNPETREGERPREEKSLGVEGEEEGGEESLGSGEVTLTFCFFLVIKCDNDDDNGDDGD